MRSFSTITVGVADLNDALELWVKTFGMEIVEQKNGPDIELARLWDLHSSDIRRQALVRTPGETHGMIHFVEFNDPDPPVRAGAEVFDSCPKNLDIYVTDLPAQVDILKSLGHKFRNENYSEVTAPSGVRFREIHLPSHDDINVVLLEVLGKEMDFSPRGYSGVGPLITIVPDADREKGFYEAILGLEILSDNILKGPEIEKMVGLPPGAALDVSIWGRAGDSLGQIEIIEYQGVDGADLFHRARPKALGVLHVSYQLEDLEMLKSRLDSAHVTYANHGPVTTLAATGETISFYSPAGLRIEAVQNP